MVKKGSSFVEIKDGFGTFLGRDLFALNFNQNREFF